eukprot:m.852340 g.852340  ORF g.852340 m.852340 type:complete len:241 (-) comp23495_c0_seq2:2632-3354(-)
MSGNRKDPSVASDWKVGGTKKGALPIRVEKRGHKTVTVVYNVLQRPDMLLYDLKRSIGTGGKLCGPGIIEIQGDQQKKIEAHLLDCPRKLQGIAGLGARKQETTHSQAKKDDDGSGATGQRRRDKPRWDRRDKESERRFVSMRCGCNWIYCSGGDNCRAIANTSQISGDTGESMMWGLEDDGTLRIAILGSFSAALVSDSMRKLSTSDCWFGVVVAMGGQFYPLTLNRSGMQRQSTYNLT